MEAAKAYAFIIGTMVAFFVAVAVFVPPAYYLLSFPGHLIDLWWHYWIGPL